MLALLLLIAAQRPTDPTIHDAKLFAHDKLDNVQTRMRLISFYSRYLSDLIRNASDRETERELRREQDIHVSTSKGIYCHLEVVVDPQTSESQKVSALRWLERHLGAEAFQRGEVPPPYNAKREKEFKAWLKKQIEDVPEQAKGLEELIKRDDESQKKPAEKK